MDANRTAASERLWAAGALLYAFGISVAVLWLLPWKTASVPSLLIALGLPLTLRLVPRNWLYGLRTKRTLRTTREVWYFQNRITGMVLVGVGVVWLGVLVVRW